MARQLQKSTLYILKMEDPSGGKVPPFYKIGITKHTVGKRIRQLQTGNPFRIVPFVTYDIEGAELVERHLHRTFSENRRILEWFSLSEDELSEVLSETDRFRSEIEELVVEVRMLDQVESDDNLIDPTEEAREIHRELIELHASKTKNDLRMKEVKSRILALTLNSKGIDGISQVSVVKPKPSFKKALLRMSQKELYDRYLTLPELNQKLRIIGKKTPSDFSDYYDAAKKAKDLIPVVHPLEVTDQYIQRTPEVVQLHSEYISLAAEGGITEGDILLASMRLKVICGTSGGIKDICEYTRQERLVFDVDKFKVDNPDVYSQFTTTGAMSVRTNVKRSRDY